MLYSDMPTQPMAVQITTQSVGTSLRAYVIFPDRRGSGKKMLRKIGFAAPASRSLSDRRKSPGPNRRGNTNHAFQIRDTDVSFDCPENAPVARRGQKE